VVPLEDYELSFSCLSLLELRTYEMYDELQKRMNNSDPRKGIILFVAMDTYKHHLLYERLGGRKDEATAEKCSEIFGEIFQNSLKSTERLKRRIESMEKIEEGDLTNIFKELISHEKSVYEEAMSLAIAKIFEERGSSFEIFRLIREDEMRHENLVKEITSGK